MTVGTDSLLGDMPLEGGSQGGHVQVAVDTTELPTGLDQAVSSDRCTNAPVPVVCAECAKHALANRPR